MTANVQCTGRRYDDPNHPDRYQLTGCATGPGPRPWKGERFAMGKLTDEQDRTLNPYTQEWVDAVRETDAKVRTAKPCPQCGGRVELIPQDSDP